MKELLAKEGHALEIIHVSSSIEACKLVSEGKADFMLSLAHADFLIPKLGDLVKDLRTAMPLFENAIFIFYRSPENPSSIIDVVENSKIFLEVTDSLAEHTLGLRQILGMLNVKNYQFVTDSAQATVMPVWGTFSGDLAEQMIDRKWKIYSMEDAFIRYAHIIEPRFGQLKIPGRYSEQESNGISTLLSTGFLISGQHVDKSELYDLITMLYENRVFFTSHDKSYRAIREDFNVTDLNFPLHAAATDYLRRNEPTFMERHAEYYGLILSIAILFFGSIQSFRSYMTRKKKDRIDTYFLEYLKIKNDASLSVEQKNRELDAIHTKALNQMVVEKLDISDFNIFSQTIKSDIISVRSQVSLLRGKLASEAGTPRQL
jgi:hypothetical protein